MNQNEINYVKNLQEQYTEKPLNLSKIDELKALDKKVKKPAIIFAYSFGTTGTLILGTGMSFAMKVIGNSMLTGIGIGILGIAMVSLTPFLFKTFLNKRKEKYANEILTKSNEILNDNK